MDYKLSYILILGCFILGCFFRAQAQESQDIQIIEDYIEAIIEESEMETSYESLYENLHYLLENPININYATTEDLKRLQLLNDFQIASIQNYIRDNGLFLSINELQLVYGFNLETVQKISPFIIVGTAEEEQIKHKYGHHQIITRYSQVLEEAKGYKLNLDSTHMVPEFRGSPAKIYTRYNYHYRDRLYWGFTAEKDAGEEFFKGSNSCGYDFYSFHLLYHSSKIAKTIAIGDYHVNFGQGLVANTGFSIGKSPDVINLRKYDPGITKFSSTEENGFMRGIAATLRLGDVDVSLFASHKKLDANMLLTDSVSEEKYFSSFVTSGIHATEEEIEDKDALGENIAGMNITLRKDNFKTGVTYLHSEWSATRLINNQPYKQFIPGQPVNNNIGVNYQLILRRIDLFGEAAMSNFGGLAFINGCLINIDPMLNVSIMHRYYQRNYYAPYGKSFSESSGINNERGTYLGMQFIPLKRWTFRAYYDYFSFPWLTYTTDAPSYGYEYLVEAKYIVSEEVNMYWRYKHEDKMVNITSEEENLHELGRRIINKFRYHISYKVAEPLYLSNRIEISEYKPQNANCNFGYMAYQDIQFRPLVLPLTVYLRYSMFDIDDFNARIYTYENDALYSYSLPFFDNQGSRFYVMTKLSIKQRLDLWLRYSQTYYANVSAIGRGWNEIEGNKKSEFKIQVRYKF